MDSDLKWLWLFFVIVYGLFFLFVCWLAFDRFRLVSKLRTEKVSHICLLIFSLASFILLLVDWMFNFASDDVRSDLLKFMLHVWYPLFYATYGCFVIAVHDVLLSFMRYTYHWSVKKTVVVSVSNIAVTAAWFVVIACTIEHQWRVCGSSNVCAQVGYLFLAVQSVFTLSLFCFVAYKVFVLIKMTNAVASKSLTTDMIQQKTIARGGALMFLCYVCLALQAAVWVVAYVGVEFLINNKASVGFETFVIKLLFLYFEWTTLVLWGSQALMVPIMFYAKSWQKRLFPSDLDAYHYVHVDETPKHSRRTRLILQPQ